MNTILLDNIKIKAFLWLNILLCCLVVSACAKGWDPSTAPLDKQALLLYDKLMFQEIVDLYENKSNIKQLSPYSLIMLCSALHELENDVQKFLKKHGADEHIVKFALAYSDLLYGRVDKAEKSFRRMFASSDAMQYYGAIGLLETALFTLNLTALNDQLLKIKKNITVHDKNLNEVIFYYSIIHSRLVGDMQNVAMLIKKMKRDVLLEDCELLMIEVESLISQNRLENALDSINSIINKFGPLQRAILLKYRLIKIKDGIDASKSFLYKMVKQNNKMWQLRLSQLFEQLDMSSNSNSSEVVSSIVAIAENRIRDLQSYLMICNGLLDYGYYIESGQLINKFFETTDNQSKFFMSNVYMAKFHYITNEKVRFNVSYATAKQQSQLDIDFLWFQFYLAVNAKEYHESLKIIDEILSFDPYEISTLYERININSNLKKWGPVISDADRIFNSRRFVKPSIIEKVSLLRNKALSHLNH